MAKAMTMIKRVPKKVRVTRTEAYLTNLKYLGEEPIYAPGHIPTMSEKARSYNWYSSMVDVSDARAYMIAFLKRKNRDDLIPRVREIPDSSFPLTPSWIARLDDLGCDMGASVDWAINQVTDALRYAKRSKEASDEPEQRGPTAGEQKLTGFIGEIETIVDRKEWSFNVYEALKANGFPTSYVNQIADYYIPLRDELKLVIANTDPNLYEGYRGTPKKEIKEKYEWLNVLVEDCQKYGSNEKKLRAPRKKKAPSMEKTLRHFVYKKEDLELKIASVNPAEIVGAQELWMYDTKYRTLTVLRSPQGRTLGIERRSIIGFDPATSDTKSVGRKAEYFVGQVKERTRAGLKRLMAEATSKSQDPKFRSSEETVVLRVFR